MSDIPPMTIRCATETHVITDAKCAYCRIAALESALKDAVEWNWITSPEDIPEAVQKRVMDALHPTVSETGTGPLSSCMCRDAFGRHLPSCPVGRAIVADGMKKANCEHVWDDSPDVDVQGCVKCFAPRPIICRHPGCTAKYDYHHAHALTAPKAETGAEPVQRVCTCMAVCDQNDDLDPDEYCREDRKNSGLAQQP